VAEARAGADALAIFAELRPWCVEHGFAAGEVLRVAGQHYRDMLLITEGEVEIILALPGASASPIRRGAGQPVGEMGFLQGIGASASVTAVTPIRALLIDDAILHRIEQADPALYVRLLRLLGRIIDYRRGSDKVLADALGGANGSAMLDIRLCRDEATMLAARRLRYDVHCDELGRAAPSADHDSRTLGDALDSFGNVFVAMDQGVAVGTLRLNFAGEGDLGTAAELYGMRAHPASPDGAALCTRLVVRRSHRRGEAAMKLIGAAVRFARRNGARALYLDCSPGLLPHYRSIGFTVAAEAFLQVENGPCIPVRLDLARDRHLPETLGGPGRLFRYLKGRILLLLDRLRGR